MFSIILNLKGMINHFNRQKQYYEKNYIQNIIFLSIYYIIFIYALIYYIYMRVACIST